MTTYFVSRHDGAAEWARRHNIAADKILGHLDDPSMIAAGDYVLGTLPLHLVVAIGDRGGRYYHLDLRLDPADRGRPLTADDMDVAAARLIEYRATCGQPWPPSADSRLFDLTRTAWTRLRTIRRKLRSWLRVTEAIVLIILIGLGINLLADIVWDRFQTPRTISDPRQAAAAGLLLGCTLAVSLIRLYRIRNRIFGLGARINRAPGGEPRPVLVTGISHVAENNKTAQAATATLTRLVEDERLSLAVLAASPKGRPEISRLAADFAEIAAAPWLQNLRAIWYHQEQIKRVLVISSLESADQRAAFQSLLKGAIANTPELRGRNIAVDVAGAPVDFNEYDAVAHAIDTALDAARRAGFDLGQICVDVTSGTKPFSIVAAAKTFGPDLRFLYVNNAGVPHSYDAEISLAEGLNAG